VHCTHRLLSKLALILCERRIILCRNIGGKCSDATHHRPLGCTAGAALHFIDGTNGVKDFDVWSFFRARPDGPIRRRRVVRRDFGHPKFGTSPDTPDFIGRPVDLLFKSIHCLPDSSPIASLQRYLLEGRTKTARCLAQQAVVLIEPTQLLGATAWPIKKAA
jgi:hypothetical protein